MTSGAKVCRTYITRDGCVLPERRSHERMSMVWEPEHHARVAHNLRLAVGERGACEIQRNRLLAGIVALTLAGLAGIILEYWAWR